MTDLPARTIEQPCPGCGARGQLTPRHSPCLAAVEARI